MWLIKEYSRAVRQPLNGGQSSNRYRYNGKELEAATGFYEYGARWYDAAVGRFLGVDPLAEEFPSWSGYSYTFNNPIRFIDPDGRAPQSPIFGKDGKFLGTDSEGYTGEVIVMNASTYNALTNNGQETLDHFLTEKLVGTSNPFFAAKLDVADLTPEAYSKILTHVLDKMSDVDVSELYNGAVSVLDRNRNKSYNDPVNVLGLAETTVTDKGIKVTANLYTGKGDSDLNTVANIQNNLGAHEFIGHGKMGLGDKTRTHHNVYKYQMGHPTWAKTTKGYQNQMTEYYLDYRKNETGQ